MFGDIDTSPWRQPGPVSILKVILQSAWAIAQAQDWRPIDEFPSHRSVYRPRWPRRRIQQISRKWRFVRHQAFDRKGSRSLSDAPTARLCTTIFGKDTPEGLLRIHSRQR